MRCVDKIADCGAVEVWESIDRAAQMLQRALLVGDRQIEAIAREFETLAAQTDRIIDRAANTVARVENDCSQSILPVTESLGRAATEFIEERIRGISQVTELFSSETRTLDKLSALTRGQMAIARQLKVLAVLTKIEIARLGTTGEGFEYMFRELDDCSALISTGANDVRVKALQRASGLSAKRRQLKTMLEHTRSLYCSVESELQVAVDAMSQITTDLAQIPAQFQGSLKELGNNISRVVAAIQRHDITRQQIEHVRDALVALATDADQSNDSDSSRQRRSALARIQIAQLDSARTSTQEWIDEIEACIEAVLRIGSSEFGAISERIACQEEAFSNQLRRIEALKTTSGLHDRDIETSLAGLGDLMHIVRQHLARSSTARSRIHLLNFNSMIEGNRLGDRAEVVLEIARNISRISADWSDLTASSSAAMEDMLDSSAAFQESRQIKARASSERLDDAHSRSKVALCGLYEAAALAAQTSSEIEKAVLAMNAQVVFFRASSLRLKETFVFISEASEAINKVGKLWGEYDFLAPITFERKELESACLNAYSTEVERRALRSALYGEPMTAPQTCLAGNEVELF